MDPTLGIAPDLAAARMRDRHAAAARRRLRRPRRGAAGVSGGDPSLRRRAVPALLLVRTWLRGAAPNGSPGR